jgi:hypothetical protein
VVIPETENHLLMIESSKYLVNQLLFKQTGDEAYDNPRNNMLPFLMNFLQVIAKFDFMEFNARPYQRLALHAIMNIYEFAEDQVLRTASAIILDYVMMKFAVSCSRERRISPFRRLQERTFYPGDELNDLTVSNGDQVGGFFHAWLGPVDQASVPTTTYWAGWEDNGVIAGLSTYRPPAAAYAAARTRHAPVQHVICHGKRGQYLSLADDEADGGVEIYYQSPSFVLNAGGSFLNSGYGHDAISLPSIHAWAQTSRARAIALIPARLDVMFGDLIRLDPYPDPTGTPRPDSPIRGTAVNMGMHRGLACGANLRVPQLWQDYTGTTWSGPWLFLNLNEPKPGNAPLGFYVAVYATPMAPAADVDPVPDNLGLFYAMEADLTEFGGSAMAFEDFERPLLPASDVHDLPASSQQSSLGDTIGWPQLARAVAGQDAALVRAGQPPTSIFTGYYAEAGALDVLGSADHLLPVLSVLSGQNAYWMWGPGQASDRTVLVIDALGQLRPYFTSCRLLTTYYAPYHLQNDWTGLQIGVCTGPVASWPTLWPHLKHYG